MAKKKNKSKCAVQLFVPSGINLWSLTSSQGSGYTSIRPLKCTIRETCKLPTAYCGSLAKCQDHMKDG